ncbi:uncharacterized protein SPPG_07432 [Spizellomyces punctatus DAOM BR117]|uniref:Uncharacterized protein n=2 Tax=Spizellomyces punctatus (strain DAOM BR117) TaxID=645134 RepID=A0A0L0H7U8_SPIPD|nr:uncharacterized protein SPPG_07432 [Spizellomyces punctatus DAOM BR117]KNC97034.1 hypothetical protein SPPG_07432 [Spizellomyces punctatus DAOM BR117]|eukprot:XP_016605074.1 hypothetical protein SPPG_07432 [Spizellomyces punctatus DAOM BR117]
MFLIVDGRSRRKKRLFLLGAVTVSIFLGLVLFSRSVAITSQLYARQGLEKVFLLSDIPQANRSQPQQKTFDHVFDAYIQRHERALRNLEDADTAFVKVEFLQAGLGNNIPQILNGMLVALLTGRVLLVDYKKLPELFESKIELNWSKYESKLTSSAESTFIYILEHGNHDRDRTWLTLATSDLNEVYGAHRIWGVRGFDYSAPLLQANPHYRAILQEWFPDGRIFYHVMRRFISIHSDIMAKVHSFKYSHFGKYTIGIHVRRLKNEKTVPQIRTYADVALQVAMQSGVALDDIRFFVAADSPSARQELSSMLGKHRVIYTPIDVVSTNENNNPGGSLADGLWDMGLLMHCDHRIVTLGSSYGQIAAAWTGLPYLTVMHLYERITTATEILKVRYWGSALGEPCMYATLRILSKEVKGGKWAEAARYLKEMPGYLHHSQCHWKT